MYTFYRKPERNKITKEKKERREEGNPPRN